MNNKILILFQCPGLTYQDIYIIWLYVNNVISNFPTITNQNVGCEKGLLWKHQLFSLFVLLSRTVKLSMTINQIAINPQHQVSFEFLFMWF